MIPVIFGRTRLPEDLTEKLLHLFSKLTFFRPVNDLKPGETDETVIITPHTDFNIMEMVNEYKLMAEAFQGNGKNFLKGRSGEIPFYDEAVTTNIKNDIQKIAENKSESVQNLNKVILSQIRLLLAEDFSIKNNEVENALKRIDSIQNSVISELKGDNTDLPSVTVNEEQLNLIDDELIDDWIVIAEKCLENLHADEIPLYIVTEKNINDYIYEKFSSYEKIKEITITEENINLIATKLIPELEKFARSPSDKNISPKLSDFESRSTAKELFRVSCFNIKKSSTPKYSKLINKKTKTICLFIREVGCF